MFKSILVPLDGSPFAEHALPLAASIARHTGATLRLLQVLPPLADRYFWAPTPGSQLEHDLRDHFRIKARTYLEDISHRLKGGVPVICDLLDEHIDIAEAIETEVAKAGIDLVVMPSHGRGALKRFWLGSIADQVYRSATVPVLLARPQQETVEFEHEPQIRHILVTLDGSAQAEDVLESVLTISLAMEADLLLVRVIPPPLPHITAEKSVGTGTGGPIDDRLRQDPPRYLQAVAEMLRARGGRVRTQLLASNEPADAIVEASAGTDLIAMQTHARRGVSRLVHGSVVHKVVNNSVVPVLISRPRNR
jgi:nucleotide-binding universal stress UspA family protein